MSDLGKILKGLDYADVIPKNVDISTVDGNLFMDDEICEYLFKVIKNSLLVQPKRS